jgi:hypothetical protein
MPKITIPSKLASGLDSITVSFSDTPVVKIRPMHIKEKCYFGVFDGHNNLYINTKGDTSFAASLKKGPTTFKTIKQAFEFTEKLFLTYSKPLPKKEILKWKAEICKGETDADAVNFYQLFADMLIAGQFKEAYSFYRTQDTFVREGVTSRIVAEMDKHLS